MPRRFVSASPARERRGSESLRSHARCRQRPIGWGRSAARCRPRRWLRTALAARRGQSGPRVDESHLVFIFAPAAEVGAIAIVYEREDAAADRNPRLARMAGLLPGG